MQEITLTMPHKAILRKTMLVALMAAGMAFICSLPAQNREVKASCMAESPKDGSVWIGSEGQGLYRLGRNGRRIKYSAEQGQIPSDSIKTLFFDAQNNLWILDATGIFTIYSATNGFENAGITNDKIDCAEYDVKEETVYYCSGKSLKTYKIVSKKTRELATLPEAAKSIKKAEGDAPFVWVFTEKGMMKVGPGR